MVKKILLLLAAAFSFQHTVIGADTDDIDVEIGRVRKELASIVAEKRQVSEKAQKDYEEHKTYLKSIRQRFKSVRDGIDSLENLEVTEKKRNDSLAGAIRSEIAKQRQYELLQDSFRKRLAQLCKEFAAQAGRMPPITSSSAVNGLAFLGSELKTKNVDNVEGIQRLFQMVNDMEELTGSIQIASGPSPVPELRGTVYRLRIGTLFEAAVDAQGKNYALWNCGDSTGSGPWFIGSDNVTGARILNAVNIREGKSLPGLVELPFSNIKVYRE